MGFFRRAAAAALSVGGVGLIADKSNEVLAALQYTDEITVSVTQTELGSVAISTWLSGFAENMSKRGIEVVHTTGGDQTGAATVTLRRRTQLRYTQTLRPTQAPPTVTTSAASLIAWMRDRSDAGQWEAVWAARANLGYQLSEDVIGRADFFWVNAIASIAGIKLRRTHDTMQYMFAGSASSAVDRSDPKELAAIQVIDAAYN